MFLILLGAFFVAFASSVIATLRHGGRDKRRGRRMLPGGIHYRILHDGSLTAAAACHNLVSGLRSADPKILLETSQYSEMHDGACQVLIMILPESLQDLPTTRRPCPPHWCIPLCPPNLPLSMSDLDEWLWTRGRCEWFKPLGISLTTELAEPHLLEAYCQAIVALPHHRVATTSLPTARLTADSNKEGLS